MTDEATVEKAMKELVSVLTSVDDPELMEGFLFGLLTKAEVKEIATRWALVREIEAGTTQREIARKYSLSLCKITRGSRELKKENSPFKRMIEIFKTLPRERQ